ncbi:MAG: DUF2309 domain-containing protein [Planctomycetia bacterium]|nr:DUF2309 domain-containing protein [Planctomycetia bacterium]
MTTILNLRNSPAQVASVTLNDEIESAARILPEQGPINVFVFENTLQALEHLPFHEALLQGADRFGHQPYLPENFYRHELKRGRIRIEKLRQVLLDELRTDADKMVDGLTTRLELRLAMLQYQLLQGPAAELNWYMAETDALKGVSPETSGANRLLLISETRRWMMRELRGPTAPDWAVQLIKRFGGSTVESWPEAKWEAFALEALWSVCLDGVQHLPAYCARKPRTIRHAELLRQATGTDADLPVNEILTRFTGAFLDQGLSRWSLPDRQKGFFRSFLHLYSQQAGMLAIPELSAECRRLLANNITPLDSAAESLRMLGVGDEERPEFLTQTLLPLRGWASMLRQIEQRGDRVPLPAPGGSLVEFVAVRLLLDRLSVAATANELGYHVPLDKLRCVIRDRMAPDRDFLPAARAFVVFQLAQVLGWVPARLAALTPTDWETLVREIEAFTATDRERVFHKAYERRFMRQSLDALTAHQPSPPTPVVSFQAVFCIDAREESFRRHLEEVCPSVQTLGAAGFFGVPIYYKGATDAHFATLCPIVVQPRHWVIEEAVPEQERTHRQRATARWLWGRTSHLFHIAGRSTVPGAVLSACVGPLAILPMMSRVLFPRWTARIAHLAGRFAGPPPTRLRLERTHPEPGPHGSHVGFTVEEMAGIGERMLRDIGLVGRLSRLVLFLGHGSECLNNPHESAYHCGACSGSPGGPNARALAMMLNDKRVRTLLAGRGVLIPDTTHFVGGLHNTATDEITLFDLSRVPVGHASDLSAATKALDEARGRNAHERCRRFHSAPLDLTAAQALRHVEGRAQDMAQTRPEYGNASNAMCIVGRRERTRGLYLDRRSFMHSYDPSTDDADGTILGRILGAVVLVCKGINLQYFFSALDSRGWGAGTKLPHNVTSLLGVMDGAASDLRTGLPWQGVELHEPIRLLMAIETTPEVMRRIMARNEAIRRLIVNGWVQLALLDPESSQILIFIDGDFTHYEPQAKTLPSAASSADWYRGWREHLEFARIGTGA